MPFRIGYRQPAAGGQGFSRTKKVMGAANIPLAVADLNQTTNQVALFRVPAGFIVTNVFASASDMDSGVAALTFNIGDAGDPDRLMAASAVGQAGTSSTTLAATGLYYEYTADTDILLACQAAAATAVAGTITLYLEGFMK